MALVIVGCGGDGGGEIRTDIPVHLLRDGDLAFRLGTSANSRIVAVADSLGMYSHVGLVYRDGDRWRVAHAVPGESDTDNDLLKTEPIDSFFISSRARHGAVMRLRSCTAAQASAATRWALEQVRRGVEFNSRYDDSDTTRLYCSQLVERAYAHAGVDIARGRRTHFSLPFFTGTVLLPGDIARNDSLTTIFSF